MTDVTVVIPLYNGACFIDEAVQSCISQDTAACRVEVLVVDDCSTDDSVEFLSQYTPHLRVISHASNQGRHAARNTGLDNACGTYVKFLDQDDLLLPDTLACEFQLAKSEDADIVVSGHQIISKSGATVWTVKGQRNPPPVFEPRVETLLLGHAVPTASALYKRSHIRHMRWRGETPRLDDWDWFVRVALEMGKIASINHISYSWRQHSGQYTSNSSIYQYAQDHHVILHWFEDWLIERQLDSIANRQRLARYYYKFMRVFFRNDREYFSRALAHIYELDPQFFPDVEPRSDIRWLCKLLGSRNGILLANHIAQLLHAVRPRTAGRQ